MCTRAHAHTHLVTEMCLTLCHPMDCSPPGSPVHGILQARILKWVAMPSSRGSSSTQGSNLGLPHCRWILYHLSHQGSPLNRNPVSKKNNQFLLGKKREWIWVGNCFWHSLPLCSPISRRDTEHAITSCLKESGPSYYPIAVSSSTFRVSG